LARFGKGEDVSLWQGLVLHDEIAGADVIAGVGILQQAQPSIAVNGEQQKPQK
jgi:hypothetical protein